MTHYICTGNCGGQGDGPQVCGTETCPKHGQPFEPCDCEDGQHNGKVNRDAEEGTEANPETI